MGQQLLRKLVALSNMTQANAAQSMQETRLLLRWETSWWQSSHKLDVPAREASYWATSGLLLEFFPSTMGEGMLKWYASYLQSGATIRPQFPEISHTHYFTFLT